MMSCSGDLVVLVTHGEAVGTGYSVLNAFLASGRVRVFPWKLVEVPR